MKLLVEKWMNSACFAPDGGGAAASPAANPSASSATGNGSAGADPSPTASAPADSPAGDEFTSADLESFGSNDDFDSVEVGGASEPPPAVPPPAATPEAKPPVQPAAGETPPPPPAKPEVKPEVPVAPPPTADASPPSEVDTLMTSLSDPGNTKALTDWLATNAFALTKEEAEAFELNAVEQIPKMMAKVQVAAMKATVNMLKNLMPAMIDSRVSSVSSKQEKSKEAVNEFYSTNTDLNAKDHGALLQKWASAFRAQNPNATRAEAIKFVGNAIRTELGMAALVPGQVSAPPVRPAPFAPARPGARAPVAQKVEENPFAALGMDLEE